MQAKHMTVVLGLLALTHCRQHGDGEEDRGGADDAAEADQVEQDGAPDEPADAVDRVDVDTDVPLPDVNPDEGVEDGPEAGDGDVWWAHPDCLPDDDGSGDRDADSDSAEACTYEDPRLRWWLDGVDPAYMDRRIGVFRIDVTASVSDVVDDCAGSVIFLRWVDDAGALSDHALRIDGLGVPLGGLRGHDVRFVYLVWPGSLLPDSFVAIHLRGRLALAAVVSQGSPTSLCVDWYGGDPRACYADVDVAEADPTGCPALILEAFPPCFDTSPVSIRVRCPVSATAGTVGHGTSAFVGEAADGCRVVVTAAWRRFAAVPGCETDSGFGYAIVRNAP